MLEVGLPRLVMTGVFSKIYPELFPASSGAQLQEITVSTVSTRLSYNPRSDRKKNVYLTQLDRKSADGDLSLIHI